MQQGHPNSFAAALTTGIAWVLYRLSLHYDWMKMSSTTALLVAGGIVTAVLFIGRPLKAVGRSIGHNGVGPTIRRIWSGPPKDAKQEPAPETPAETSP